MHLTNLTSLPSLLPLTTLTALLLTAEWSVDTPAARRSLTLTKDLTNCPSIQFLELSITPTLLHKKFDASTQLDQLIYNLTSDPPYLPHLRVFQHTDDGDITLAYEDAFDPPVIARFLASICGQPFPNISSRDSVSAALRRGEKAAIIIDQVPFSLASKPVFEVFSTRPGWVIAHAGVEEVVFRERHGADSPSVVLVDRLRDAYETISLTGVERDTLEAAVERFEALGMELKEDITKRVLRYFREPRAWRQYFEQTTPMGLDGWMGIDNPAQTESYLWVFVTVPWCGFCQRALPEFERFVDIVRKVRGVHAVIVDDTGLPRYLDRLVDGFPTVLLLRENGNRSSVVEYLGERSVSAFLDVHYGDAERALRSAMVES